MLQVNREVDLNQECELDMDEDEEDPLQSNGGKRLNDANNSHANQLPFHNSPLNVKNLDDPLSNTTFNNIKLGNLSKDLNELFQNKEKLPNVDRRGRSTDRGHNANTNHPQRPKQQNHPNRG